jgi:hypothetical protein
MAMVHTARDLPMFPIRAGAKGETIGHLKFGNLSFWNAKIPPALAAWSLVCT